MLRKVWLAVLSICALGTAGASVYSAQQGMFRAVRLGDCTMVHIYIEDGLLRLGLVEARSPARLMPVRDATVAGGVVRVQVVAEGNNRLLGRWGHGDRDLLRISGQWVHRIQWRAPLSAGPGRIPEARFSYIRMPLTSLAACFAAFPMYHLILLPFRRKLRTAAGTCAECGYDLTGNISGRCPECGALTGTMQPGTPVPGGGNTVPAFTGGSAVQDDPSIVRGKPRRSEPPR